MADAVVVSCPLCRQQGKLLHSLHMYQMCPFVVDRDGSLMFAVGICAPNGEFIYQTSEGIVQVNSGVTI